ncbi:ExbD/TolR family protein [Pandoraea sp. NPDC090278]|uniref:ExbD/TolR family protein n=1 Tax=Pandoraea sp. NPDC090278 TaxID=3364391 RepID=UPI00383BEDA3
MGMNVSQGKAGGEPEVMVDINTTPLIDVMLVLLIMLIITIPIQMHAVKMNLPVGNAPPAAPPEVVRIDIGDDGVTLWNGAAVPDGRALENQLTAVARAPVQAEIHLHAARRVPYRDVAAVMASAQRVGATKLALIGNE